MKVADHILLNGYKHVLYDSVKLTQDESIKKSKAFYDWLETRRSVREYSSQDIPKEVIENIIKSASTAPSGAHKQPWTFCAVSNPELKHQIRLAAEVEERETYSKRMSERWRKDLAPLGTDTNKPFIDEAPWIIVGFKRVYEHDGDERYNNYYVNESIGIASGFLITAIHNAGLVTLTHTPSPMNFLTKMLNRPINERAYLLLPIGYPKQPAYVPDLDRKPLEEVAVFYE
ncbi:nitroreductase family protein [Flavobacteriaceae bacterium S0825]|uniref:nitroreductase family protein n=1 Tax=Gaetbulibacter sp. S0825 TaxID=2720084 RepID=UPI001430B75F|nr:nitroreductase family protein [Gaetbulibacter sp. S0825]MCK0109342.1 nitroreductase family protein [Flavobacteriaceae bacterium S0825]NIX64976.1 nitroreductase family protein [Gaetbulibacter sp. S0825]